MNRSSSNWRESLIGGRNIPVTSQNHRRGQSFNGIYKDADEKLDLFSKSRHALSVVSPDESSDVSVKLGRLSIGSVKQVKSGLDDLLASTDGGKHDYDWLLTPPGTPLFPSSDGKQVQPPAVAPRSRSLSRSSSTTKASRLSVSQSESHNSSRPARSSSVTRPSISSSQYSSYSSNRSSSILNTSSASVSSYIRPSSPVTRSPSIGRPSTPSSRPSPSSRSSTPSRARPTPTNSVTDKSRPSRNSRPSTPTSRQQIPENLSSGLPRSNSRPSTPTRRTPVPSLAAVSGTASGGRVPNGRISSTSSRSISPGPQVRPQLPVVPPDFPSDTPPNLRTTFPDRPLSAGRSRPAASVTAKTNLETTGSSNMPRRHPSPMTSRHSSPVTTRGRITDTPGKARVNSNGHASDIAEPRKVSHPSDSGMRKPVKSSFTDNNGFGRTISKKSLDMAIRHMDLRNGSTRPLSGTLFPQSIRSAAPKSQSVRNSSTSEPLNGNVNNDISDSRSYTSGGPEGGSEANDGQHSAKLSDIDIYESSRYDAILLKEDLKDANWLHSVEDKSDQGSIFDNGFEPPPEPFGLL